MSPVTDTLAASRSMQRHSIQRHSRSFSFASRLLPASGRDDVERLYAWCRWCDDGVDAAASPREAESFLQQAADDVDRIASGQAPVAVESDWLATLVRRYNLPIAAADALLQGMRSDLEPAAGWGADELLRYCFRVAGAVGVLMCPILGLQDRRYLPHAAALGMGMQMTNIARDVAEDWQRGRCYLPVEWTQGLSHTISREPEGGAVQSGVRELLAAAYGYYAAGESGIAALESGSRLAVRAASKIYHAIGTQIRKRQYQVLDGRARVSLMGKVGYFGTAVLAGFSKNEGLPPAADAARALAVSEKLLFDHGVLS